MAHSGFVQHDHRMDSLPPKLRVRLEGVLDPGEQVVWCGRPKLSWRALLQSLEWLQFPAILLFIGGVMWLRSAQLRTTASVRQMLILWGLFVVPALPALVAFAIQVVHARSVSVATVHAITDRRFLTVEGVFKGKVRSCCPENVSIIEVREWSGGCADVVFQRLVVKNVRLSEKVEEVGFFKVREGKLVERLIRELIASRCGE